MPATRQQEAAMLRRLVTSAQDRSNTPSASQIAQTANHEALQALAGTFGLPPVPAVPARGAPVAEVTAHDNAVNAVIARGQAIGNLMRSTTPPPGNIQNAADAAAAMITAPGASTDTVNAALRQRVTQYLVSHNAGRDLNDAQLIAASGMSQEDLNTRRDAVNAAKTALEGIPAANPMKARLERLSPQQRTALVTAMIDAPPPANPVNDLRTANAAGGAAVDTAITQIIGRIEPAAQRDAIRTAISPAAPAPAPTPPTPAPAPAPMPPAPAPGMPPAAVNPALAYGLVTRAINRLPEAQRPAVTALREQLIPQVTAGEVEDSMSFALDRGESLSGDARERAGALALLRVLPASATPPVAAIETLRTSLRTGLGPLGNVDQGAPPAPNAAERLRVRATEVVDEAIALLPEAQRPAVRALRGDLIAQLNTDDKMSTASARLRNAQYTSAGARPPSDERARDVASVLQSILPEAATPPVPAVETLRTNLRTALGGLVMSNAGTSTDRALAAADTVANDAAWLNPANTTTVAAKLPENLRGNIAAPANGPGVA